MLNTPYIFEGKTTNEAIEKGLKELQLSRKDVEIKVLQNEEKRNFFSILSPRIVKVELILKDNSKKKKENNENKTEKTVIKQEDKNKAIMNVETFLKDLLPKISSEDLKFRVSMDNYYLNVDIDGDNTGFLIGYRGETLNALQILLSSIASKQIQSKVKVVLNISGYIEKRRKVLEELAERISNKVIKNKKAYTLEPMTAYERKIIHEKIQKNPKVKTTSIGEEPYRKVVISLK